MAITLEEFEDNFREAQDIFLNAMAENPDISLEKFYSMTCIMENLYFFSPVLFSLFRKKSDDSESADLPEV